ncbi:MAG: peptidoglycan-binding protein [Xanthobacteraceae bacterium]|nr:peptidoglycan-binding protein [Xanthobacteraceae bacterium]
MDDETPRRPRRAKAAKAVAIVPEPNFVARVLLHSPKDTLAAAVAVAAALAIMINALFLQAGRHPSPMFGASADQAAAVVPAAQPMPRARPIEPDVKPADIKPAELKPLDQKIAAAPPAAAKAAPATPSNAPRPPAAIPTRNDPIGDLVTSSRRIASVQRALTEYGYGQLKPTGVVGPDTQAAIKKFENDRRKPQTGQMSDWLQHEIVKLTGRPLD